MDINNPVKPNSPNLPLTSIIMDQDYYLDQCQTYYKNEDLNLNELDEEANLLCSCSPDNGGTWVLEWLWR